MSNITNKNKKILAITGYPGVGKSTLALKIAEEIKNFGCLIGGFITPEKRINNIRVGFSIIDLISNKEFELASINKISDIKIGRYYINKNIGYFLDNLIKNAVENTDVILIDEIGPMELKIESIDKSILYALNSGKPILTTFYIKLKQIKPEIFSILSLGEVIQIGFENRYSLSKKANEFARWLIDGSCSSKGR
ncbi:MAG: nucleoside-triphosphatase [Caldisphaera sp.]